MTFIKSAIDRELPPQSNGQRRDTTGALVSAQDTRGMVLQSNGIAGAEWGDLPPVLITRAEFDAVQADVQTLFNAQLAAFYEEITYADALTAYTAFAGGSGLGLAPAKWYLVTDRTAGQPDVLAQFRQRSSGYATAYYPNDVNLAFSYFIEDDTLSVAGGIAPVYLLPYTAGALLYTNVGYFLNGNIYRWAGPGRTPAPATPDFTDAALWELVAGGGSGVVRDVYGPTANDQTRVKALFTTTNQTYAVDATYTDTNAPYGWKFFDKTGGGWYELYPDKTVGATGDPATPTWGRTT